ncbi:MAG: toxin-antitoxin system HicB family antitoxin [Clostridiales bacterium]|nr:toxin-antitoxin system HicB family antitoxin [Candidatus Coliplasma equi]
MKTIDYYMNLPYKMEIVADVDEGGFIASFPDLPGCLTCGDTIEKAAENANDAKKAWIEAAIEDNIEIREPSEQASYSGQFKLRLPKTLHRTLAEQARAEGISMNQYCIYLLSKNSI